MQPKIILTVAWADRVGVSDADIDSLLDLMASSAIPAGPGDLCPRCRNHPVDSEIQFFAPESVTATAEQVRSRAVVKCLCGTTYWYAAVHAVDVQQPIGQATVCAASASRTPETGALDGQALPPVIVPPEDMPPGRFITTPDRWRSNQ